MRKGLDFDESRIASHTPSQSEKMLLLAVSAAQVHVVRFWDIAGVFKKAPNDPRFSDTMLQSTRANRSYKESRKNCFIKRAIQGDPAANAQSACWRDYCIRISGQTLVLKYFPNQACSGREPKTKWPVLKSKMTTSWSAHQLWKIWTCYGSSSITLRRCAGTLILRNDCALLVVHKRFSYFSFPC